jgi:hypothetical protein
MTATSTFQLTTGWDDPAFDPELLQEFGRTMSDPAIKEADQEFTCIAARRRRGPIQTCGETNA